MIPLLSDGIAGQHGAWQSLRMITPAQCRAARALIRWKQDDLARESHVSVSVIRVFENEGSKPRRLTLEALARALEAAGVEFIPANGGGPGVRIRDV